MEQNISGRHTSECLPDYYCIKPLLMEKSSWYRSPQTLLIIVASLGYFVDIYDLILFNVVKKASLLSMGYTAENFESVAINLFNMQMIGMLVGGILWGVLGDSKGRLQVLFGSILMYSLANIANAYVTDIYSYGIIRLLAGIGLAGELGAGITLVSETMSKEKRGYGTMIIVTFGALGAVLAALVANRTDWHTAYLVGGGQGLILLALRLGVAESGMFKKMNQPHVRRGDFISLFRQKDRFLKYLKCIFLGLPIWFVIGVPIALAELFSKSMEPTAPIVNGTAIMFSYIGLSAGDLLAGLLSQVFRSRKKVVLAFLVSTSVLVIAFLLMKHPTPTLFYTMCFLLGIATGYWGLFVTVAAEQFGTNIRATVATTVPNFVRGAVVPITLSFKALFPTMGLTGAALLVGSVCMALAAWATLGIKDTFGKDLDYLEGVS